MQTSQAGGYQCILSWQGAQPNENPEPCHAPPPLAVPTTLRATEWETTHQVLTQTVPAFSAREMVLAWSMSRVHTPAARP